MKTPTGVEGEHVLAFHPCAVVCRCRSVERYLLRKLKVFDLLLDVPRVAF